MRLLLYAVLALCAAAPAASGAPFGPARRGEGAVPLPRVRLIATGGTIANGLGGRLGPADLASRLASAERRATIEPEAFSNVPSATLSLHDWARLAARLRDLAADAHLAGVVVTSGTDTLEELAWFLELTVRPGRPVVLVGAMRRPGTPEWDGDRNLADAVSVAIEPASRSRGILVVLNGQVQGARRVTKRHTTDVAAFDAPPAAIEGRVRGGRVRFRRPPAPDPLAGRFATIPWALPRVDLLLTYQGATGDQVAAAVAAGARGVVVAAAGAGSVTPAQASALRDAAGSGVVVIIASRTGGAVAEGSLVRDVGAIASGDLSPVKARLLLMLALAARVEPGALAALFDSSSIVSRP